MVARDVDSPNVKGYAAAAPIATWDYLELVVVHAYWADNTGAEGRGDPLGAIPEHSATKRMLELGQAGWELVHLAAEGISLRHYVFRRRTQPNEGFEEAT